MTKTTKEIRKRIIDELRKNIPPNENWQQYHTPYNIVDKMIEKIEILENKTILVLFNLEFLERLIYKYNINTKFIAFVADNEYEETCAKKLYNLIDGSTCIFSLEDFKSQSEQNDFNRLIRYYKMSNKKFDICFSNPPYGRHDNIDLQIIESILPICQNLIIVHPLSWLFDIKRSKPIFEKTRDVLQNKVRYIDIFNGNPIFNIHKKIACGIVYIDNHDQQDEIIISTVDDKIQKYKNINDITIHYEYWENIALPFLNNIKSYCKSNNIWNHTISDVNYNPTIQKYYFKLPIIQGSGSKDKYFIVNNDFFTFFPLNTDIRKKNIDLEVMKGSLLIKKSGRMYATYEFNSSFERDNFINYLKTFFARFCLTFSKNGANLSNKSTLNIVPWMDFTQEWDDEKLFKFFNIDKETQDYIYNFLPDYHGILKK